VVADFGMSNAAVEAEAEEEAALQVFINLFK